MCGGYTATGAIKELDLPFPLVWPEFDDRYNLHPFDPVPVIREPEPGGYETAWLQWWLVPFWAKEPRMKYPTFNARSETAHEKASFREPFKRRRCLLPADGFYERAPVSGTKRKQPWYVRRRGGAPFCMAGLWDRWRGQDADGNDRVLESVTVLTTAGNELLAALPHPRMPVILDPGAYALWLDPEEDRPEVLRPLLGQWPAADLEAWPVDTRINHRSEEGPDLLTARGEVIDGAEVSDGAELSEEGPGSVH